MGLELFSEALSRLGGMVEEAAILTRSPVARNYVARRL